MWRHFHAERNERWLVVWHVGQAASWAGLGQWNLPWIPDLQPSARLDSDILLSLEWLKLLNSICSKILIAWIPIGKKQLDFAVEYWLKNGKCSHSLSIRSLSGKTWIYWCNSIDPLFKRFLNILFICKVKFLPHLMLKCKFLLRIRVSNLNQLRNQTWATLRGFNEFQCKNPLNMTAPQTSEVCQVKHDFMCNIGFSFHQFYW